MLWESQQDTHHRLQVLDITCVGEDLADFLPLALGHALGSSGTRLLGTLLDHLEATGGRLGLQTMCEGGGMANALILERL